MGGRMGKPGTKRCEGFPSFSRVEWTAFPSFSIGVAPMFYEPYWNWCIRIQKTFVVCHVEKKSKGYNFKEEKKWLDLHIVRANSIVCSDRRTKSFTKAFLSYWISSNFFFFFGFCFGSSRMTLNFLRCPVSWKESRRFCRTIFCTYRFLLLWRRGPPPWHLLLVCKREKKKTRE